MWDERYKGDGYAYGIAPNDFLKENFINIKAKGRVLCIGEGEGRNALFLLKKGFDVVAVDLSHEGKKKALKLAGENGFELNYHVENLLEYDFGIEKWDAIISIFCHLPENIRPVLHQKIINSLSLGGVLVLEGYNQKQLEKNSGGPKKPEMLFTKDEFTEDFRQLTVKLNNELDRDVFEGEYHNGLSSVLQFIAIKGNKL